MLAPNTTLQNRYRIVRKLGQGGMGTIYEALDTRVNCVVALKETLVGASSTLRDAFRREAELLANLRHQSLPKVTDHFGEGDGEFLVMEFIAGDDLLELVTSREGPLPQLQVLAWAVELLKLLEYLHTHEPSIIHRDIKPANIKTTKTGEIFLLDFGLAKGASGQMLTVSTDSSVPGYTPIYSPLEQILGQGTDQRSDIYALGASLYHLLTGTPPVSAPLRFNAIENNQPDPLKPANQVNIEIAPEVSTCIQSAMALSRRERTDSAHTMRIELERAIKLIIDREIARKAELGLVATTPERDPSKALVLDDNVQFTVYAPEKIKPDKNYSLLAFAHLTKQRADAAPDEPDPLEEMKNQAARVLGEQRELYRDTKDSSAQPVPRGGQLTFVPVVRGLTFNPPSRSFNWEKSVHREEFDVRSSAEFDGRTLSGSLAVFLGSVVIADVPLTISVDSKATPTTERISLDQARTARRVKQVFASYSQKDEQVVAELANVAPLFGSRFIIDRTHLEPGEDRIDGVQRLIREADVFQLFWSTNSMRSNDTVNEIKYAAGLGRPGFILPTYWEEPLPRNPAEGLPPPEIERLQFHRIYPGAISAAAFGQTKSRLVVFGPTGAEIYLDDQRHGSIGSSGRLILMALPEGRHLLRVTRAGYRDDERVVEITAETSEQTIKTNFESVVAGSLASPVQSSTWEKASTLDRFEAEPQTSMSEFAAPRETVTAEARFETADMVVCVTCRMRYPAGTRFCTNDGSVLVPDVPVQAAMPHVEFSAAPRMQAPPVAAKHRSWVPIYAGAAMILLVMIAAPVWFLSFIRTAAPNIATNSNTSRNSNTPAYNFDTPDFQFQSLNGGTRSLNDFRGRVLLLNFWSTVGDETRNEAPGLNELQKRLGPRGLSVVGVSDTTSVDAIRNFQKETPLNYEVLIGGTPGIKLFRILTFPTTIIIDRRGHTTKRLLGVQDLATIESEIEPLLKQTP